MLKPKVRPHRRIQYRFVAYQSLFRRVKLVVRVRQIVRSARLFPTSSRVGHCSNLCFGTAALYRVRTLVVMLDDIGSVVADCAPSSTAGLALLSDALAVLSTLLDAQRTTTDWPIDRDSSRISRREFFGDQPAIGVAEPDRCR